MKKLIKKLDKTYMSAWDWATSTKGAAYVLSILIWTAVLIDPPKTIKDWLLIVVTVYYQGVALSTLGSGQKAEALETRQLLIETHEAELDEISELKHMQDNLSEIIAKNMEIYEGNQQELADIKEILELLKKG